MHRASLCALRHTYRTPIQVAYASCTHQKDVQWRLLLQYKTKPVGSYLVQGSESRLLSPGIWTQSFM